MSSPDDALYLIVGAGSGIGRSLALALARERRRIGLIGLFEPRLRRVAEEVVMFGGEPFVAISDVRDPISIRVALAQIALRGWTIPQTFLCAGISEALDLNHFSASFFEEMVQINLMGAAHWLEALQPVLRAQPCGGEISVLSSLSADRAIPGGGAGYSASKAALSQLLDGLRAPWSRQNIRLVTVAPGFVKTALIAGMPQTPMAIEPEEAARIILRGLRRGKRVIRFHPVAAFGMALVRLLPPALLDRLDRGDGDIPRMLQRR